MSSRLGTWLDDSGVAALGVREADVRDALSRRYEVLSFVGAGAAACVLKVADLSAGREVRAVKLAPLTGRDPELDPREAARAEFALAARFDHPNLARYFDLDVPPEGPFALTTMEFVDGVPFGTGNGRREPAAVCGLAVQMFRGLAFLHDAGLVHGDVKPSNVLCGVSTGRPWAKLLDFHLTITTGSTAAEGGGGARGTLRYMAPEVIAGQAPGPRSDLYSAGVVLYEALAGRPLFEGTPGELAAQHLAAPTNLAGDAGVLATVLDRLLSKHPDGRYRSASEAVAAIAEAAGRDWPAETQETLLGRVRSVPLVGRDDALRAFSESVQAPEALAASGKAVVVQGRPGLGKSRFLRECQVRAQCEGVRALRLGRADTADALLDAVGRWAGSGDAGSGDTDGEAASPALPADTQGDAAKGLAHLPAALMRRCNALADRLVEVAGRRRTALLLDDAETLPPDAIECLLFLMRGTLRAGVGFGLTLSGPAEAGSTLSTGLETWRREDLLVEVVLDELGRDDTRRLIQSALPATTPAAAVDALVDNSGGSPEVVALTLEHLIATGTLTSGVDGEMVVTGDFAASLPDGLTQLTARAVESVDGPAREVLRLLAVSGEVDAEVLTAAAGVDAGALDEMLREGAAAPLVSCRQTDLGVLCKLQHPRLADALLEGTSRRQVQRLHDRLADAIEAGGVGEAARAAAEAAKHRLQGRTPQKGVRLVMALLSGEARNRPQDINLELARMATARARGTARVRLQEIAGDLESARGRSAEAIALLRAASRSPRLAAPDRARLLRKLGSACAEAGYYARARRALQRAMEMCGGEEGPATAEAANIILLLARTDYHEAKYPAALEGYARARQLGRELQDEHVVARALNGLGLTQLKLHALMPCCRTLVRAVRGFRKTGDRAEEAGARASLGYVTMLLREWQRSTELLRGSLAVLEESGHLTESARALSCLGSVHQKLCAWDAAAAHYEQALALYERLGGARRQAAVLVNLSQVNAALGILEAAISQARMSIAIAPGDTELVCHAMNRQARAQYALGDLDAAHGTCARALELAGESGLPVPQESAFRTLGEIATLQGDRSEAEKHFRSALGICRANHWEEREAVCLARSAELLIVFADPRGALALAEEAGTKIRSGEQDSVRAVIQMVRGKALLGMGMPDEALRCLTSADEVFQATRVWDDLVEVSSCLGMAYAGLGQLRFAALCYRLALGMVEQVASHLRLPANRTLFLADPRRGRLFGAASDLRGRAADCGFGRTQRGS